MSILVDKSTRLVVQGITGREGEFHARQMVEYGTNVVAGVTPGKGGGWVAGIPLTPLLTMGAIDALRVYGSRELLDTYLPKMVSGEWTGTMNLTEPHAGSDLGGLRTRAEPQEDGTYRLFGTKIDHPEKLKQIDETRSAFVSPWNGLLPVAIS